MEIKTTFFYRAWKSFTVKRYGNWKPVADPELLLRELRCFVEHFDESVKGTEWLADYRGERVENVRTYYSPNIRCGDRMRRLFRNVQVKVVCEPVKDE